MMEAIVETTWTIFGQLINNLAVSQWGLNDHVTMIKTLQWYLTGSFMVIQRKSDLLMI